MNHSDRGGFDHMVPAVYEELRRQARHCMRGERPGHTLQPTALVHETYLRLAKSGDISADQRAPFLALAARTMRRVLVDYARSRRAEKRGAEPLRVTLTPDVAISRNPIFDVLALDEALERLEAINSRQVRIAELRYLAGLTVEETAATLGISAATIDRESAMVKAWLYRELHPVADD